MKGGRDRLLRAGLLATSARFDRERDRGRSLQGAAESDIDGLRGANGKMKLPYGLRPMIPLPPDE